MAQIPYRANLSSATFPLVISKAGRSVVIGQADQNYDRRVDPVGDTVVSKASVGIPQAIFMQDVVPTIEGFQSISYRTANSNDPPLDGSQIVAIIKLSVATVFGLKRLVRLVFYADATVRSAEVLTEGFTTWNAVTVPGSWINPITEDNMHWGNVQGTAYILRSDNGFLYRIIGIGPITITDVTGTVTGAPGIVALCSSYNYTIRASLTRIYWSSLTNPVDFVASLVTGAGFVDPSGNETAIKFLLPHPTGFFIYTSNNIISARYTGNRAYPWRFIPIADSGRVEAKSHVAWNSESQVHFSKVTSGSLMQITPDRAEIIFPEISEYIEKETYYDSFNPTTNVFTRVAKVAGDLIFQCRLVQDKYLYISHITVSGLGTPFQHILIYDVTSKRIGKLVKNHIYVDEDDNNPVLIDFGTVTTPLNDIYYVEYNINRQVIGTDVAKGVLLLGRFSYIRNRLICIEGIDIQSIQSDEFIAAVDRQFTVLLMLSMDGVNFDTIYVPTVKAITKVLATYYAHSPETLSVCILLKGAFNVQSLSMLLTVGGHV